MLLEKQCGSNNTNSGQKAEKAEVCSIPLCSGTGLPLVLDRIMIFKVYTSCSVQCRAVREWRGEDQGGGEDVYLAPGAGL